MIPRLTTRLLLPVLAFLIGGPLAPANEVTLTSPGGLVRGTIAVDPTGALVYSAGFAGRPVIGPSRIGVTVDGTDLGAGVKLGQPVESNLDDTFPVVGVKRSATTHARVVTIPVTNTATGHSFTLEARAYDDGFAWRLVIPGTGARRITGEASSWQLPAGSRVWYGERNNDWKLKSYAGEWMACEVDRLPTISKMGPVQAPPLVLELKGGGYALLTEAALYNYSGLRLRAVGHRTVQADFTEGASGFTVTGTITTPWRVTLLERDLNALVNSDVIAALNPAPDPTLFPDTSYIKPGRSVWRFLTQGTGTPAEETHYVDCAAELGFEYSLVDEGWEKWPDPWADVARLVAYGRAKGIGIFIWKNSKDLFDASGDRTRLRDFLDHAKAAGVAGVKIDYLNGETKALVDYEIAALRMAAKRRLMVDIHGVFKPTGESRTYPNEISREAIRGLELNNMKEGPIPARHNAALPFTRFAVGHADYTPLGYSMPGPTTWAHQLATVVEFTSPLLVIAENADRLLRDPATRPALDVLEAIPSVWDETRVLPPSAIGEVALMARRSGKDWFVALLNGRPEPIDISRVDLSFLGNGHYRGVLLTSPSQKAFARRELADVSASTPLALHAGVGDGAVLWLRSNPAPQSGGVPVAELQTRGGLPNVRARIERGEEVRVAYLGGSITAAEGWRVFTLERLRALYPGAKFTAINAAVSGTGSDYGAARLQRDVLRHHPDLLFVEFSVNDGVGSPEVEAQMEGIVRQTWLSSPQTDICFVYTVSVGTMEPLLQGHYQPAAAAMERVAEYYAIPSFNFGVEIIRRLKAGTLVMSAPAGVKPDANGRDPQGRLIFTRDGIHPGDAGHRVYSERLMAALPRLLAAGRPGGHEVGKPRRPDNWQDARMVLIRDLHPGAGWHELDAAAPQMNVQKGLVPPTWFADQPGTTLEFQFRGTVLGLVGLKGPDNGEFEVTVDGAPARRGTLFDSYSTVGRYYLKPWFYSKHLPEGLHHVRLTIVPSRLDKARIMAGRRADVSDPAYAGHGLYLSGILINGEPVGS